MRFFTLNQIPMYTDDFYFGRTNNRREADSLVIFNPIDSLIASPVFARSRKSLEEHIEYIQKNDIRKVILVAEDISFIKQCPNLEVVVVFPAVTANDFDYSPLYELKNIKFLTCETIYGIDEEKTTSIDYSRFKNLREIGINGAHGHLNVGKAGDVVSMYFQAGFPISKTLEGFIPGNALKEFSIIQSPIQSLAGIEVASQLISLELDYNRRLTDISALQDLSESLISLVIDTCGKIRDFSVLKELHNLEYLTLKGSNTLPDLSFLKEMPLLKSFWLTMDVADGDLSLCKNIPSVKIRNRRHFSHKDNDLPKTRLAPDERLQFEIT